MRKNQKQTTASKKKISLGISKLIARRKAEGKSWGAPLGQKDLEQKKDLIQELLHRGYLQRQIAQIIGVPIKRFESYIQTRKVKPKESHLTLTELVKRSGLPFPEKKKRTKR